MHDQRTSVSWLCIECFILQLELQPLQVSCCCIINCPSCAMVHWPQTKTNRLLQFVFTLLQAVQHDSTAGLVPNSRFLAVTPLVLAAALHLPHNLHMMWLMLSWLFSKLCKGKLPAHSQDQLARNIKVSMSPSSSSYTHGGSHKTPPTTTEPLEDKSWAICCNPRQEIFMQSLLLPANTLLMITPAQHAK